ncbi:MAG: hypothetical protein WCO00_04380 [Rhodospirillaceae bacterium]
MSGAAGRSEMFGRSGRSLRNKENRGETLQELPTNLSRSCHTNRQIVINKSLTINALLDCIIDFGLVVVYP